MPGGVSSRCAEGVLVVCERELAACGWWGRGEPEEEVASGVVGVWEQVLGELGLVGGGGAGAGRGGRARGAGGARQGDIKEGRGRSGGLGERIGCRWLVDWW